MCTYIRKLYMAASTWTMSHYGHSGTGTETVSYRNSGVISKPFFIFCATLCIHLCHTVTHTQTHINKYYWAIEVKCACLAALDLMYSRFVDTYACTIVHHFQPPSYPTIHPNNYFITINTYVLAHRDSFGHKQDFQLLFSFSNKDERKWW